MAIRLPLDSLKSLSNKYHFCTSTISDIYKTKYRDGNIHDKNRVIEALRRYLEENPSRVTATSLQSVIYGRAHRLQAERVDFSSEDIRIMSISLSALELKLGYYYDVFLRCYAISCGSGKK